MGLNLKRKKKRVLLLSLLYAINRILPFSKKTKFKLYLDLEWAFNRLSHELSFNFYDGHEHPFRKATIHFLAPFIEPKYRILDLGCKQGEISYLLSNLASKVVGIDYDEVAISYAKETYKKETLEFIAAEASDYLEKSKDKFDLLVLSHILEHLDNPVDFLKKFKNHFKLIYLEVPDFESSYSNRHRLKMGNSLIYTDIDHISEFDRQDIIEVAEKCNLNIIASEYKFGIQRYVLAHSPS